MPSFLRIKRRGLTKSKEDSSQETESSVSQSKNSHNDLKEIHVVSSKSSTSKSRSRSASPFSRFRSKNNEKNDTAKRKTLSGGEIPMKLSSSAKIKGLSDTPKPRESRRSRSASPFRFRRKKKDAASRNDDDENIFNESRDDSSTSTRSSSSKMSDSSSVPQKSRASRRNSLDKKKDLNTDVKNLGVYKTKSKSKVGVTSSTRRPPLMRNVTSSAKSSIGNSVSTELGSIHTSVSFDSVMKYPPSKLINSNKLPGKLRSHVQEHGNRNSPSKGRSLQIDTDSDSFESGEEVELPVHSHYGNVLDQLRASIKEKEIIKASNEHDLEYPSGGSGRNNKKVRGDYGPLEKHFNRENYRQDSPKTKAVLHTITQSPSLQVAEQPTRHTHRSNGNYRIPILTVSIPHSPNALPSLEPLEPALRIAEENYRKNDKAERSDKSISPPVSIESAPVSIRTLPVSIFPKQQRPTTSPRDDFSDTGKSKQPISLSKLRRRQEGKVRPAKRMHSTKSKSVRRLFNKSHSSQDERGSKPSERRRNFAFITKASPSRKKMSTATLEKNRAHARQLAMFAGSPRIERGDWEDPPPNIHKSSNLQDGFSGDSFFTPKKAAALNFEALDTDSVFSGNTSVHDTDFFDEGSVYSNTSTFSSVRKGGKSKKKSKGRPQHQNSTDTFSSPSQSSLDSAFHPLNMKNRLSQQRHNFPSASEASVPVTYVRGNSARKYQNGNQRKSNASTVSTGSSISGAAARRLLRRSMNMGNHQQQQSHYGGGGSVASDAESQYSAHLDDSSEKSRQIRRRPPISPVPFMRQESHRPQFGTPARSKNVSHDDTLEIETGFTFDAFGLDEHQIDNDVNAAIAELVETNPDISFFMDSGQMGFHKLEEEEVPLGEQSTSMHSAFPAFPNTASTSSLTTISNSFPSSNSRSNSLSDRQVIDFSKFSDTDTNQHLGSSMRIPYETQKRPVGLTPKVERESDKNQQRISRRSIKESIKNASEASQTVISRPNMKQADHQPTSLPDIESEDSADSFMQDDFNGDLDEVASHDEFPTNFNLDSGFQTQSHQSLHSDSKCEVPVQLHNSERSPNDQLIQRQDSNSINSIESGSKGSFPQKTEPEDESEHDTSSEEVHFVPRQKSLNESDLTSESQKRAAAWASERSSPIIVSPLLVPKSGRLRKRETPSQKRAKAWAGESPGSPDVLDRAPQFYTRKEQFPEEQLLAKDHPAEMPISHHQKQFETPRKSMAVTSTLIVQPTQSQEHACYDESTVYSEDKEIAAINKKLVTEKIMQRGHQLPIASEKVVLRKTGSPVLVPNYEKYKSSAPKVALRKVQPKVLTPEVKETPNFLANVKLRKIASPTPRVEHDDSNSPTVKSTRVTSVSDDFHSERRETECKPSSTEIEANRRPSHQQEHVATESALHFGPCPLDEQAYSKNENVHQMSMVTPKKVVEKLEMSKAESTSIENKASIAERNMASNEHQSCLRPFRAETERIAVEDNNQHPLAAMFAARGIVESEKLKSKAIEVQPRDVPNEAERSRLEPLAETINANPVAAEIVEQSGKGGSNRETKVDSHAHPVAALFASRSRSIKVNNNPAIVVESNANPVAALFAARSEKVGNNAESEVQVDGSEPSTNNVSALFAQRASASASANMERKTSTTSNRETSSDSVQTDKDNGKLLALFSKRSSAAAQNSSAPEQASNNNLISNEMSENSCLVSNGKLALKDDPTYAKYFKMLKMGLPLQVVKHAMIRDGLDADVMDGDHNQPVQGGQDDSGIPLQDDPKYTKYFKMLKMGLPMGAVKNAMVRDGEDPAVMDGDHNQPAQSGNVKKAVSKAQKPLPKDKYRRTRLHWDTLHQVKSTSVWALVNQDPDIEDIEIDESEFAELFQAEVGQTAAVENDPNRKKNAVKVIDPKRANNGGIVLARLKITYEEMAVAIDTINDRVMNIEQVQGILEYIPTKEEKQSLRKYMTSSEKDSADAFDELCECEKFMVAMMTVKHSKEKVRALLFKLQFRQCVADLEKDITTVEKACDELNNSVSLRKLLGIVLNIGNRLNTAGPTRKGKAGAFTIESLLKLNLAKAFDKKTTFLHYIVLIVMRHNSALTNFKDDLTNVLKADKIYWDQIEGDLEEVENQLENVRKIALHEVFGKKRSRKKRREDDELSENSMTLEEEVEALRSTQIGIFTLQAIKIVSALRESVELTRSKFKKVLEYFGEDDKKKLSPHELFEIICVFTKDFDSAKEKVAKLEKEKIRRDKKKRGVRDESPNSRSSWDSGPSKGSIGKESSSSSKQPNPLRISSMQPHVSSRFPSRQDVTKDQTSGKAREGKSDSIDGTISESCESSDSRQQSESSLDMNTGHSLSSNKIEDEHESSLFQQSRVDSYSSSGKEDKPISDDSNEEFDENFEPCQDSDVDDKPAARWDELQQDSKPLRVVERNSTRITTERGQIQMTRDQSMRQRARAMRQERMKASVQKEQNDTATDMHQTRRKPPAPEGARSSHVTNNSTVTRDRIRARRDRLRRSHT